MHLQLKPVYFLDYRTIIALLSQAPVDLIIMMALIKMVWRCIRGIITDLQVRATTRAFSQALVGRGVPGKIFEIQN